MEFLNRNFYFETEGVTELGGHQQENLFGKDNLVLQVSPNLPPNSHFLLHLLPLHYSQKQCHLSTQKALALLLFFNSYKDRSENKKIAQASRVKRHK
jgi:hypothetical protein